MTAAAEVPGDGRDVETGLRAQVAAHLAAGLAQQDGDVDALDDAHGVGQRFGLFGQRADLLEVRVVDPRVGDAAPVGDGEPRHRAVLDGKRGRRAALEDGDRDLRRVWRRLSTISAAARKESAVVLS